MKYVCSLLFQRIVVGTLFAIMDLMGPKVLGPWYNFARLFGYFPAYGLSGDYSCWEVTAGIAITLILGLANIGFHSVIWWMIPVKSGVFNTTVGSRVEETFHIVDSAVPVLTILFNLMVFGHLKQLFGTLHETEELLNEIHIRLEYDLQRVYTRIVIFVVLVMQIVPPALIPIVLSDSKYYMDLLPITIYMAYRQLSNLSFLGSVTMILMAVFIRFKSINVCLFGKFLRKPSNIVGITLEESPNESKQDPLVVITLLSRIHHILCGAVEQINLVFSFQVRSGLRDI